MAEESLGVCRTSDDLRARFAALGVSLETVDHIAGLPTRYTAKVIGLQPTRRFGQFNLDDLLGAAGIMLVAFEDTEALARVQGRLAPLQRVDCGVVSRRRIIIKFTPDFMRKIGRLGGLKGGRARAEKLSARRRREIARHAAIARWGNAKDA